MEYLPNAYQSVSQWEIEPINQQDADGHEPASHPKQITLAPLHKIAPPRLERLLQSQLHLEPPTSPV
jgi:hypothetical protein